MRTLLLIAVALALTSCARTRAFMNPPPRVPVATKEEMRSLYVDLAACHAVMAPKMDDRISDAHTIARAVANACYRETQKIVDAESRGKPERQVAIIRDIWSKAPAEYALKVVLENRAQAVQQAPSTPVKRPEPI